MSESTTRSAERERQKQADRAPRESAHSPQGPTASPDILALQQSAGNAAVNALLTGANTSSVQSPLPSDGVPLEPSTRAQMESRFGQDFSAVRVHTDERAAAAADAQDASAYTLGQHIVFGQGSFAPGTTAGTRLLSHELAHVIQQRRGGATPQLDSNAPHEQAAERASAQVAAGSGSVAVEGGTAVGVARAPKSQGPASAVLEIEWKPGMNANDVRRKVAALDDLASRGKLEKLEGKVDRKVVPDGVAAREYQKVAPKVSTEYRYQILEQAHKQIGPNSANYDPVRWRKFFAKWASSHADHVQELQLKGLDADTNTWMLDGDTNVEIGRQIRSQLLKLPPGTKIVAVRIKGVSPLTKPSTSAATQVTADAPPTIDAPPSTKVRVSDAPESTTLPSSDDAPPSTKTRVGTDAPASTKTPANVDAPPSTKVRVAPTVRVSDEAMESANRPTAKANAPVEGDLHAEAPKQMQATAPATVKAPATAPKAPTAAVKAPTTSAEAPPPTAKTSAPTVKAPTSGAKVPTPSIRGQVGAAAGTAAVMLALDLLKAQAIESYAEEQTQTLIQARFATLQPEIDAMLETNPQQVWAVIKVVRDDITVVQPSPIGPITPAMFPPLKVTVTLAEKEVTVPKKTETQIISMGHVQTTTATYSVLIIDVAKELEKQKIAAEEKALNERMRALAKVAAAKPQAKPEKQAPEPRVQPGSTTLLPPAPAAPHQFLPGAPAPSRDEEGFATYARGFRNGLLIEGMKLRNRNAPMDEKQDFKLKVQVWRGQMKKLIRESVNFKAKDSLNTTLYSFDERMNSLGSELGIDDWKAD